MYTVFWFNKQNEFEKFLRKISRAADCATAMKKSLKRTQGGSSASVADPDPGSNTFDSWIRDPGWKKYRSGINIPDHISESLVTICFVADPNTG
jgi:hypothetical protein